MKPVWQIVLSELTNTLYLATKNDKRELTEQEIYLIKYKFEQDKLQKKVIEPKEFCVHWIKMWLHCDR